MTSAALSLVFLLLRVHDLQPYNLLNYPDVLCLGVNDALQILQAVLEILDLPLVKVLCAGDILLDKEACANVHQDVFMVRQLSRYI